MSGRALILLLIGVISVAVLTFGNIYQTTIRSSSHVNRYYFSQASMNIAQTGRELALRHMKTIGSANWHSLNGIKKDANVFGGKVEYEFSEVNFDGETCVKVLSRGIMGVSGDQDTSISIAFVRFPPPPSGLVSKVKAAVGTATNVGTNGNLLIDGKDHDKLGNPKAGTGTFAVWSLNNVSIGNSVSIGGTTYANPGDETGTDFQAVDKGNFNAGLVQKNQVAPFPDDPDSVFSFPKGTLKDIAITNGTYYTNPALITYPLNGVTYVELAPGNTWTSADIHGSGVLVIHNSTTTATAKINKGGGNKADGNRFTGLVIADNIDLFHAEVIGAVIELTKDLGHQTLGNGNGFIKYSREALSEAEKAVNPSANIQDLIKARWDGKYSIHKAIP